MFYSSISLLKLIRITHIVINILVTTIVIIMMIIMTMTMIYNNYYIDIRLSDNQILNNCIIELL